MAWRVSQSGDLAGLPPFSKLFSVTLYPYAVGLDANQPSTARRTVLSSGGRELIAGADLRLKIGNSVDGNITYNPDFATVEADLSTINLTRYETFYPEKRLYFLEGAELFSNPINVFYSRRIGDIDWGVKTNGRIGKVNYAVLGADERTTGGDPSSHTEAFRLQRDILRSSNVGLTGVSRSWDGGYARVLSLDGVLNFSPRTRLRGQRDSRNDRLYLHGLVGWRFMPPFGAVYLAYTTDRSETVDEDLGRAVGRRDRALFVKLTVPVSVY